MPKGVAQDGLHLIVMGMVQNLVYGWWSGTCSIDGQMYTFKEVLGTVEHVNARW